MKKRILITGGTGYLGSNIINAFKDHYDFVLLKRESSDLRRIESCLPKVSIYNIDEVDNDFVQKIEIDILLHCATHYGRKDADAVNSIEVNLLFPLRLLSLFKKHNKKIIFINTDTILDKNINAYSLSKCQFKEWMKFFSDSIPFINIQLEHFYGPNDDRSKFVSFLINAFLSELPEINLTKGEQNRYFTFIDDIVSAFGVIIDNINKFPLGLTDLQISNDQPVNLKEFIMTVQRISGNNTTRLNFGSIPYRDGELMHFPINSSLVKSLGWRPQVSLEQGLFKTIESDKNNR
jgi:nucleoside-diphosphate-sugar epimerase